MDRRAFLQTVGATIVLTNAASKADAQVRPSAKSKKAVLISMLPKDLAYGDRFRLARDAGFEAIEMQTIAQADEAAEIGEASKKTGLRIPAVPECGLGRPTCLPARPGPRPFRFVDHLAPGYARQQLVEGHPRAAGRLLRVAGEDVVQQPLPRLQELTGTRVICQHVGVPHFGKQVGQILGRALEHLPLAYHHRRLPQPPRRHDPGGSLPEMTRLPVRARLCRNNLQRYTQDTGRPVTARPSLT